jgi:hypothetical protein
MRGLDQSRAPSLHRRCGRRHRRYYEPLGLPLDASAFRHRLMAPAFARRGPSRRASPVPCRALVACPALYPGGILHRSASRCSLLPSPRHDRLGFLSLSGSHLTRLQASRSRIGPATLLPAPEPYSPGRAFDAPLRRRISPDTRGLLRGAAALTATGLPPASSTQLAPPPRISPDEGASGRDMRTESYSPRHGRNGEAPLHGQRFAPPLNDGVNRIAQWRRSWALVSRDLVHSGSRPT